MSNNYQPIYSGIPSIPSGGQLTNSAPTAVTKSDGVFSAIGTDCIKIFTSAATYGSYLSSIRMSLYGIVAGTASTATVIRFFLSSITSGATTAANTWLLIEVQVASQTAASSTTAVNPIDVVINRALPPGYTILASQHAVAASNTGWQLIPFAGDYVSTP